MIRNRFALLTAAVALLGTTLACGGESEETASPADTLDTAPDGTVRAGSIAATPTAADRGPGLEELVNDIRTGIEPLPARVEEAPDSVRQTAVRLYVTRQEVLEAKWGPRAEGVDEASPLAVAVIESENRFHALMELLGGTPPPDSTAVAEAVAALDTQLAEVLLRAAEAERSE